MDSSQLSQANREILWNLNSTINVVVMYALFALAMAVCANGLWARFLLWKSGSACPERLGDWLQRFGLIWSDIIAQKRVNRDRNARLFHTLILWGFVILLFTTTMVFIDHDLGIKIYKGRFYLAVTILSDLFGLALLVGLMHVLHFRYLQKPERLHSNLSDATMIILLGLMVVQGFLLEGLRIQATDDPWALYSPVGYLVAQLFWSLSDTALRYLHFGIWWFHTVTVFSFIALLPYTKFMHILTSSANLYFRNISRPKGALAFPGDIDQMMTAVVESDAEFNIGISTLNDISWKQRLDFDACTSCGRCQDVCPAYNSDKALSPKWLILDSKSHMLGVHSSNGKTSSAAKLDAALLNKFTLAPHSFDSTDSRKQRGSNTLVQAAIKNPGQDVLAELAGDVMEKDVFWSCTTCRACVEVCPVGIDHVDYIVEARRGMALMKGELPSEAQASIRAIETRGNPFGPAESRADWMEGLEVPILQENDSVDILYWVGCISAFDKRKQQIARSMVKILNASGVNWGTFGNQECCTGDPARRLGEENVFQASTKQNLATLHSVSYKRIVANCPHCFNSIKNEYPQLGSLSKDESSVEVIHHSHLIMELMDTGLLPLSKKDLDNVTFHDPCYLGRYNDTYDEPREILVQLGAKNIPEMSDNRAKGKCCGAGGGHYWFDMKVGQRVNSQRIDQALETKADTIATACPFCMQMLEDGSKLREVDNQLEIRDIAELVADALS